MIGAPAITPNGGALHLQAHHRPVTPPFLPTCPTSRIFLWATWAISPKSSGWPPPSPLHSPRRSSFSDEMIAATSPPRLPPTAPAPSPARVKVPEEGKAAAGAANFLAGFSSCSGA